MIPNHRIIPTTVVIPSEIVIAHITPFTANSIFPKINMGINIIPCKVDITAACTPVPNVWNIPVNNPDRAAKTVEQS